MRASHIETICAQILTNSQSLHEAVVVVPHYNLVSIISATLHRLGGAEATMLPKFFTLEALYNHMRIGVHEANSVEKMVILGYVLKNQGISLSALDEYFSGIENYKDTQIYSHTFLKVRDAYIALLESKNIKLPLSLGLPEIKWLINTFTGNLFIIPTLENFDDLSLAKANLLPLPPLDTHGIIPEMEDFTRHPNSSLCHPEPQPRRHPEHPPLCHPELVSGSTLGKRGILKQVQDDSVDDGVGGIQDNVSHPSLCHPELVSGSSLDSGGILNQVQDDSVGDGVGDGVGGIQDNVSHPSLCHPELVSGSSLDSGEILNQVQDDSVDDGVGGIQDNVSHPSLCHPELVSGSSLDSGGILNQVQDDGVDDGVDEVQDCVITTIEYSNKFELTRAAVGIECDYIIVESDEIRDLLRKEFAVDTHKNLAGTHEFKLFHSIAKLAFDPGNLDYLIELMTNPTSILHNTELSWLRANGDLRSAHTIISGLLGNSVRILEQIGKISKSIDYTGALILHNSTFLKLLNEEKCNPHTLFEVQQHLRELKIYLGENPYKFDRGYVELLSSLANKHSINTNSSLGIISLKQADYLDFGNIVLIENGLSKLEKAAQEDSEKEFKNLCTRLLWLLKAKKLTVLRVSGAANEESIFYSLLKTSYPPTPYKATPYKKRPHPQPYVAVPQELRPKQYSVTAITKLIADPYSYYAEYILNLRHHDRIWEAVESRDFGILVHNVLSKIHDENAIEDALNAHELTDSAKIIWREKLVTAVDFIKSYYLSNPISKYFAECKGEAEISDVIVTARADRIDISAGRDATIIDIKTGYAPSQTEVNKGIAPQLAIESWILSKSGFPNISSSNTCAKYFAINGRLNGQTIHNINLDDSTTEASLTALFESFYTASTPYFATPIAQHSNYIHLKRLDEWFESA